MLALVLKDVRCRMQQNGFFFCLLHVFPLRGEERALACTAVVIGAAEAAAHDWLIANKLRSEVDRSGVWTSSPALSACFLT